MEKLTDETAMFTNSAGEEIDLREWCHVGRDAVCAAVVNKDRRKSFTTGPPVLSQNARILEAGMSFTVVCHEVIEETLGGA